MKTSCMSLLRYSAVGLLLAWSPGPASATSEPAISLAGEHVGRIEARSADGTTVLDAKSQVMGLHADPGQSVDLRVTSLYEPESGLFWWTVRGLAAHEPEDPIEDFRRRQSLWIDEHGILAIEKSAPPPSLCFVHSEATVTSRGEGELLMRRDLVRRFGTIQQGRHPWLIQVSLWNRLDTELYYDPYHANPRFELEVVAVQRHDSGWGIEVSGRQDRRAFIELDRQLGFVHAELLE